MAYQIGSQDGPESGTWGLRKAGHLKCREAAFSSSTSGGLTSPTCSWPIHASHRLRQRMAHLTLDLACIPADTCASRLNDARSHKTLKRRPTRGAFCSADTPSGTPDTPSRTADTRQRRIRLHERQVRRKMQLRIRDYGGYAFRNGGYAFRDGGYATPAGAPTGTADTPKAAIAHTRRREEKLQCGQWPIQKNGS